MTGLTNYTANNELNWLSGRIAQPALPGVWMALFTAVGTDAGSGFTEVAGNGYVRPQVAGTLAAGASFTTGSSTITLGSTAPAWLLALGTNGSGVKVYDVTVGAAVGEVLSVSGTTVTLTGNSAINSSGSTDSLTFSAFGAPTGTAPSSITNSAVITMAQSTDPGWGTVISFGLYDASTSGNLTAWDFLGDFQWLPFESTAVATGNGPVFSAKANGYSNNDPLVASVEYGGTFPTLSVGVLTAYNVFFAANVATDTFTACTTSGPTTAFAASTTGSGMVRKIRQQSIPGNITASFAAGQLTITAA